jgi:hypothetical protein
MGEIMSDKEMRDRPRVLMTESVPVYIVETPEYIHPDGGRVVDPAVMAVAALTQGGEPLTPAQALAVIRTRYPSLQGIDIKVSDMPARQAWGNVLIDGSPVPESRFWSGNCRGNYLTRGWCEIPDPERYL